MSQNRIETTKRLRWVPISEMRVSGRAQRDQRPSKVNKIASDFDLEKLDTPTVNERDGIFWIIDGAHRVAALRKIGWGDQQLQCWCYVGLTEEEEAEKFLALNDSLPVAGMDKFKVSVVAGRADEVDIDRIVRAAGLSVGGGVNGIQAVSSLHFVYDSAGPKGLATAVRIIRDSYGKPGFAANVLKGVGMFVAKYENVFEEERFVSRLSNKMGGVNGLLGRAEQIRSTHGVSAAEGVAAAAVETYNQGRGGAKIPGWWTTLDGAA